MVTQATLPLASKTAMVTGSSRGIGAEIAYELAKRGVDVIIICRTASSTKLTVERRVKDLLNTLEIFTLIGDISKVEGPESIIEFCKALPSRSSIKLKIDILVNNARVEVVKGLGNIIINDYNKVYDLNVRGIILMT